MALRKFCKKLRYVTLLINYRQERRAVLYRLLSEASFKFLLRSHLGISSTTVTAHSTRKSISVERYAKIFIYLRLQSAFHLLRGNQDIFCDFFDGGDL